MKEKSEFNTEDDSASDGTGRHSSLAHCSDARPGGGCSDAASGSHVGADDSSSDEPCCDRDYRFGAIHTYGLVDVDHGNPGNGPVADLGTSGTGVHGSYRRQQSNFHRKSRECGTKDKGR
ncbi:hypothetical protein BJG92_02046 [Arthrobacter sp. SO5]|nr:hypothetical protein [Arthrobacter sp. SO5]